MGCREAETIEFLDRYLSGIDFIYAKPDGSGFETLEGKRAQAWRQRIGILREKYVTGIGELDRSSRDRFGADFARLTEDQQDAILADLERPAREAEADVEDAWGLPVARITLTPHPNDLAQGRYLIDRNAEILEAAGAKKVYRVYIDRITGNCSHQHGTTRMGDDPETSVLNRWCQAHEVDNLFVVDGGPFPTGTGANPTLTIMANAWRVADHIADRGGVTGAA